MILDTLPASASLSTSKPCDAVAKLIDWVLDMLPFDANVASIKCRSEGCRARNVVRPYRLSWVKVALL